MSRKQERHYVIVFRRFHSHTILTFSTILYIHFLWMHRLPSVYCYPISNVRWGDKEKVSGCSVNVLQCDETFKLRLARKIFSPMLLSPLSLPPSTGRTSALHNIPGAWHCRAGKAHMKTCKRTGSSLFHHISFAWICSLSCSLSLIFH